MPQSAAARVATATKRLRCVELAGEGLTYAEIAERVGFADKSAARKAVVAALTAREAENVDSLRESELLRLDQLQLASWDMAMQGDPKAVDRVLRIITLRAKLLGLFESTAGPTGAPTQRLVTGDYTEESLGVRHSPTEIDQA